jgi:hypothetical protein
MAGCVHHVVLRAPLDEELPGDEKRPGEDEREHRGRELTGIIHREEFSIIGSHRERGPTTGSSYMRQINCRFFPIDGRAARRLNN